MSTHRLNVLVYTGVGSTVESVKHCLWSLRRLLSPNYAVIPISADAVLKEPWTASCALFVMPGGADLGYCRVLNGEGNRRISQYVNKGGAYLGLCAGGYYACKRCEFEEGNASMEVVGDRELGFFPGVCRGLAYPGFVYHSEGGTLPEVLRTYYNGGGVFMDADRFQDRGVQVLAEFTEPTQVGGHGDAAVIYCKVGNGAVVLTSPHPEFAAINLGDGKDNADYPRIVAALEADDKQRADFFKACLAKLGLKISQESVDVPSLSRLYLSSRNTKSIPSILQALQVNFSPEDSVDLVKGENDTFKIEQSTTWSVNDIKQALPATTQAALPSSDAQSDKVPDTGFVDPQETIKTIVFHDTTPPDSKETPYFNHHAFYSNLESFQSRAGNQSATFGQTLLYGEVVTSTNTMLEKNPSLLDHLPTGLVATATTQVAGRGRGSNVWVSPPGSLMFSTVLRHPLALSTTAPVVFIQYLAALAIVSGIHAYDKGYASLPVRLKWPNDIYVLDPSTPKPAPSSSAPMSDAERKRYVKIGGILVGSSYTPSTPYYTLVCGIGINVSNAAPTTSLNQLAAAYNLPPFSLEKLLASILNHFEALYDSFCTRGFTGPIMRQYEAAWLHSGQIVTLEEDVRDVVRGGGGSGPYGEERYAVRGISADWGLLVVEEVMGEVGKERGTGRTWELQSDSNSFDFFKGLVKKKT